MITISVYVLIWCGLGVFWLGVAAMLLVAIIVDYAEYKRYERLINFARKKYEKTKGAEK